MSLARVLIIDDDAALLQALPQALRLRMEGVTVKTCGSAIAALDHIAVTDFDAIVSDIKMPGMDGLALLSKIRTLRPETPTLLITGHGEHDLAVQALRGGAYDFIQKPIDREYFIASLSRAIQMRQLSRQVEQQRQALANHANNLERTVEERTRDLRQANQIKDEFLATLSHELRTPLNAILGWSQLLRHRKLAPTAVERALEVIERNAKLQTQLIDDLLDVSRIITGKLRLETKPVELIPVIEAALDTVRPAVEAKGIQLTFKPLLTEARIWGDKNRLQQIVWNLLSNAIKFTPEGGQVMVCLERVEGDGGESVAGGTAATVQLTVTDNGRGINPQFLPYVFDRFRQEESTTTRTQGGLGLGLAIVRHLVELHGGTVAVSSQGQGQGASFQVWLPLAPAVTPSNGAAVEGTQGEARPIAPATAATVLQGVRLLLVDDEVDALEFLGAALQQFGAEVISVTSAQEALHCLHRNGRESTPGEYPLHLLVSDIGMPEEDGYGLIQKVRALKPEAGGTIPAIALTAYARPEDEHRSLAAGFQVHLSKPVDLYQLVQAIAQLTHAASIP
jgi:signal transduction histidine kinase